MFRKTLLWLTVVALVVGASGALALAGTGGSEEYTGCLTNKGKLVRVAEGAVPKTGSCRPNQTMVHLAGTAAIEALQLRADDLESRLEALETLLAGVTRQGDSLTFPDSIFLPNGGVIAGGNLFAGIDVNAGGNIFGANIGSRGEITANGMIMSADRVGAECSNFVNEVCMAFLP